MSSPPKSTLNTSTASRLQLSAIYNPSASRIPTPSRRSTLNSTSNTGPSSSKSSSKRIPSSNKKPETPPPSSKAKIPNPFKKKESSSRGSARNPFTDFISQDDDPSSSSYYRHHNILPSIDQIIAEAEAENARLEALRLTSGERLLAEAQAQTTTSKTIQHRPIAPGRGKAPDYEGYYQFPEFESWDRDRDETSQLRALEEGLALDPSRLRPPPHTCPQKATAATCNHPPRPVSFLQPPPDICAKPTCAPCRRVQNLRKIGLLPPHNPEPPQQASTDVMGPFPVLMEGPRCTVIERPTWGPEFKRWLRSTKARTRGRAPEEDEGPLLGRREGRRGWFGWFGWGERRWRWGWGWPGK